MGFNAKKRFVSENLSSFICQLSYFFLLKERANSYVLRQLNKLLVFFLLFRQVAAGSQNQAGDPAVEGKSPSADQVATKLIRHRWAKHSRHSLEATETPGEIRKNTSGVTINKL